MYFIFMILLLSWLWFGIPLTKTSVLTNLHVSRQVIAFQQRAIHVHCAVHNCDSYARKCQNKNNKNYGVYVSKHTQ